MDISFIIPTIGRVDEVVLGLQSILDNTPKTYEYEVLIIDQNGDNRLDNIIENYTKEMNISQYKVSFRGVSRARNYGMRLSHGEFLNFPDDDSCLLEGSVKHAIDF